MRERIAVLGAGSWGTTIASLLAERHDVALWARSETVADEINRHRTNHAYLGSYVLPQAILGTPSLAEAVDGASVVLVAVPSHGVRSVLSQIPRPDGVSIVISLAKGLEEATNLRMTEVISECWEPGHLGVLTGPNLAQEIREGQPTASVVALADPEIARTVQEMFASPTMRIYTNPDIVGCEIAGVAKNVMAIAIGMATGLGLGDNSRATLITRSLAEISRLGVALGGRWQTFAGLAGLGDLVATSLSTKSRNFSFGAALGTGRPVADILGNSRMVAEGYRSCRPVVALAESLGVEVPVAREVVLVCHEGSSPREAMHRLMSRAAKSEFDDR